MQTNERNGRGGLRRCLESADDIYLCQACLRVTKIEACVCGGDVCDCHGCQSDARTLLSRRLDIKGLRTGLRLVAWSVEEGSTTEGVATPCGS